MGPVEACLDELSHGLGALVGHRDEIGVGRQSPGASFDDACLGFDLSYFAVLAGNAVVGAAVHRDHHRESDDHPKHDQRGTTGAAGPVGGATGALALLAGDEFFTLQRGSSSTARPVAPASRAAETSPAARSSSTPTVCGLKGTRNSLCSARAKPEICSAEPLSTMLEASPPPS